MELSAVSDNLQIQLREFIAQRIGLHFPSNRWGDLQRGLAGAVGELGFADLATGAEWLLSTPLTKTQVDVLASHLTIGETYFFREKKTFEVLAQKILPKLVHSRCKRDRRLRIWSAACCTGEEPYSLAILLQQVVPDLADWNVTILATDINARFLQKAAAGVYGEWSFRDTPTWFKDRYFNRTENGRYAILPEIKKLVTFVQQNLVQDVFPSLVAKTNAMDLIFCRNALMYFSPVQAQKVVRNLRRALVHDGWLVVSPSEASQTLFSHFAPVNFPGVILYQKRHGVGEKAPAWLPSTVTEGAPVLASMVEGSLPQIPNLSRQGPKPMALPAMKEPGLTGPRPEPYIIAESLYESGQYAEAVDTLLSSPNAPTPPDLRTFSMLTRALANQGKLTEALGWCERWVKANKLDASSHYVRAVILQELGNIEQAQRSLQTVIYLEPRLVLAHFALGNVARAGGKLAEANKHFVNASRLLRDYQAGDVLPESDGLTADRLTEIINSITAMEVVS
jgi:chemotaxis protein methyltransferase CheR